MTVSDERVTYQFDAPIRSNGGVFRTAQLVILAIGGAVAFSAVTMLPPSIGSWVMVAALGIAFTVAFIPVEGRPLDEWIPAASYFTSRRLLRKLKWANPAAHTDDDNDQVPPPPLADWRIMTAEMDGHMVGFLRSTKEHRWTVVLSLTGETFALADEETQAARLTDWGAVQSRITSTPIDRWQWIARRLPEVGDEMRRWHTDHAVMGDDTFAGASYLELLDGARRLTPQNEVYLVLSVTDKTAARQIADLGRGDVGAAALLYQQASYLTPLLEAAGCRVNGLLTDQQVSMLIRTLYDPLAAVREAHHGRELALDPAWAWPAKTKNKWGFYQTDQTWHTTFWASGLPSTGVPPDFLHPLLSFDKGIAHTVAFTFDMVPPQAARRKARRRVHEMQTTNEDRASAGGRVNAVRRRDTAAAAQVEGELAAGHNLAQFSGFVTVSGRTLAELRSACVEIEQAAAQSGCALVPLLGEQDTAFSNVLPTTKGLT